jgi:hypothetical protein
MPSRGREVQAAEAFAAFAETKRLSSTEMLVVLDEDEPGYESLPTIHVAHVGGMANALNAALPYASPSIYGFIGDDHRFRTVGWDERIAEANAEMGGAIVYGDDLLRGEELPSQVFIDARIVKALGWMALPGAKHLFLDDAWRELGSALGRLRYRPDVVIEHLHPTNGKAQWDDNYRRVNAPSLYAHDASVFHRWMNESIDGDCIRVEQALR